jgi:hypothetical protein
LAHLGKHFDNFSVYAGLQVVLHLHGFQGDDHLACGDVSTCLDLDTCDLSEDPHVIKKILSHLGLPAKAPTIFPARGPPLAFGDHQQLPDYDLA